MSIVTRTGEVVTDEEISAASKILDIPDVCIRARVLLGWRKTDALTKPPRRREAFVRRSWQFLDRNGFLKRLKEEQANK